MDNERFKEREARIDAAGLDEDWLASLGLALVPIEEVQMAGHKRAAMGELMRVHSEAV